MEAKIFEGHGCTTMFHNALLDVVMPELNAKCDAAWPILCLIIRQTRGWNRDEQGLSYRQIMAGTGIRSRATVVKALNVLLGYRFPIVKIVAGSFTEASRYSINRDVTIDWTPVDMAKSSSFFEPVSSSKNELGGSSKNEPPVVQKMNRHPLKPSSKNEPGGSSKNELIYRKEEIIESIVETKGKGTALLSSPVFDSFAESGVLETPTIASKLEAIFPGDATNYQTIFKMVNLAEKFNATPESITGWLEWVSAAYPAKIANRFLFNDTFPEFMSQNQKPGDWLNGSIGTRFTAYVTGWRSGMPIQPGQQREILATGKWLDSKFAKSKTEWEAAGLTPINFTKFWFEKHPNLSSPPKPNSIPKLWEEFTNWVKN